MVLLAQSALAFLVSKQLVGDWAMRIFKKLWGRLKRASPGLRRIKRQPPRLFAHWQIASLPRAVRQEPNEPRGLRPDLVGRGGATPPRYSTRLFKRAKVKRRFWGTLTYEKQE